LALPFTSLRTDLHLFRRSVHLPAIWQLMVPRSLVAAPPRAPGWAWPGDFRLWLAGGLWARVGDRAGPDGSGLGGCRGVSAGESACYGWDGAYGFAFGRRLLSQGHQVRLLVRSPERAARSLTPLGVAGVESVVGDVAMPGPVEEAMAGCDAVLHAAAVYTYATRAVARIGQTNVRGTEIVLGAAARAGLDPIVHVSSCVALYPPGPGVLTPDSPVTRPQGTYCRSKAESERVARRYQA
jgi:NAD dependent epimerase/dehydratase family